jgi:RHS repeat-associated protein
MKNRAVLILIFWFSIFNFAKADTLVLSSTVTTMPFSTTDSFQINSQSEAAEADFEILVQNGDGLDYFPQPCNTGSFAQKMQCKAHNNLTAAFVRINRPSDMVIKLNGTVIIDRTTFPKEKGQFVYHARLAGQQILTVFQAGLPTSSLTLKVTKQGSGNVAPIAGFTFSSNNFTEPSLVSFSALNSVDPDGVIVDYSWNFGDGSFGAGALVNHIYDSAGQYYATLTVTDNRGATSSHSENVIVQADNVAPIISNILPANNSTFAGSFVQMSGQSNESLSKVEIQVNDGAVLLGTVDPTDSFKFSAYVPFDTGGVKNILIRAYDVKNNSSDTQVTYNLDFNNSPLPKITVLSQNSDSAPSIIWFDGSGTTDLDGDALTYEWNFGDGSEISSQVKPTHLFKNAGSYTVSLKVTDAHGLISTISKSFTLNQIDLPIDPAYIAPPLDQNFVQTKAEQYQFLYNEDLSPQKNVDLSKMDSARVTPLHGRVLQGEGQPLSAVKISVLNHPEYGFTFSREDGNWDLAVNGGGDITVKYEKVGFTSAQRLLDTLGMLARVAPDVVLSEYDQKSTEISLNSPVSQFHESSIVQDESGSRKTQILIPENTSAVIRLPDGTTKSLSKLTIRATEVTFGSSGHDRMPAPLPPRSAYTYCADFTADEAQALNAESIEFSNPIPVYVDNHLNIPTGMGVPSGYFNKTTGLWESSNDGVIITLLGIDSNLKAQLDIEGNGNAANSQMLASWGITDSELQTIAQKFQPGQSFMRVRIKHFSFWDFNETGSEVGTEGSALRNFIGSIVNWSDGISSGFGPNDPSNYTICPACAVDPRKQILFETIDLPGIDFKLHYSSDRSPGANTTNTISFNVFPSLGLSGEVLTKADVTVEIAGKVITENYDDPVLNTEFTYVWDGKDSMGRQVYESTEAAVTLSYYFWDRFAVAGSTEVSQSFNNVAAGFKGMPILQQRLYKLSQTKRVVLSPNMDRSRVENFRSFNGWSITPYHRYDVASKTLYTGSGKTFSNSKLFPVVTNVAGNGSPSSIGENVNANNASLNGPTDLTTDAAGNIFFTDADGSEIRKIDLQGIITHVAGNGNVNDYLTDNNGPALNAGIGKPYGIRVSELGEIYFTDSQNSLIRKIDVNGNISIIAGTGISGYSGDNGPAVNATLSAPSGLAIAADGSIFIADTNNYKIRKISSTGVISTFIDGYLYPKAVAVDRLGNVYFTNTLKVYLADTAGNVSIVAGNSNEFGSYQELVDATGVTINPVSIALDKNNQLYITDAKSQAIRTVNANGKIQTVAGSLGTGFNGNGLVARDTKFANLKGIWVDSYGAILVADQDNHRIRRVGSGLPDHFPAQIASPDGSEIYYFNEFGLHYSTKRADTGTVKYAFIHNTDGKLIQVKDAYEKITYINRNSEGNLTSIVGPYGQTYNIGLDSNNFLASISDPLNNTTRMTYSDGGLMKSFQRPEGNVSFYEYNPLGRINKTTEANGGSKTFVTLAADSSVKVQTSESVISNFKMSNDQANPSIVISSMEVPGISNVTKTENVTNGSSQLQTTDFTSMSEILEADPRFAGQAGYRSKITVEELRDYIPTYEATKKISYSLNTDGINFIKSEIKNDNTGHSEVTTFNSQTRTITNNTSLGHNSSIIVDGHEKPILFTTGANILPVEYQYNEFGKLKSISQGNRVTFINYDQNGFLSEITDPENRSTRFLNDQIGRLQKVISPDNQETNFQYDRNSNLTGITPPQRSLYQFVMNAIDIVTQFTVPGSTPKIYEYDLDRRTKKISTENNTPIWFSYGDFIGFSSFGQITSIATDLTLNYYYENQTKHLSTAESRGFDNFKYTVDTSYSWARSLLTGKWYTQTDGSLSFTVLYGYNAVGLPISENSSFGVINYDYNEDYLLTKAGDEQIIRDNSTGIVTQKTFGNFLEDLSYNEYGELSQKSYKYSGTLLYKETYSRDKLGRIVEKQIARNGISKTLKYEYDLTGRLIKTYLNNELKNTYTYDAQGNRLTRNGEYSATFDGRDRISSSTSGTIQTNYTYNDEGTVISEAKPGSITDYSVSVLGPLTMVQRQSNDPIQRITYRIDGELSRINKMFTSPESGGPVRISWGYDKNGRIINENRSPDHNYLSRFIYSTQKNSPDYMISNYSGSLKKYFFVKDQLGSVLEVLDEDGNVVQELEYDEFGRVTMDTNPGFQPFGFAGGLYDPDTGLTHFGARDYNPETGRWLERDPILFNGGSTNLYAYCGSDPVNCIDPSGLYWFRQPGQEPGQVGRAGSIVPPQGTISEFIEKYIPAGYSFGQNHDAFVDWATSKGVPDGIANIPSMIPLYLYSLKLEVSRSLGLAPQPAIPGTLPQSTNNSSGGLQCPQR